MRGRMRVVLAVASVLLAALAVPGVGAEPDPEQQVEQLDEDVAAAQRRADRAEATLAEISRELLAERDELVAVQGRLDDAAARLRMTEGQLALAERELAAREEAAARAAERAAEAGRAQEAAEAELAAEEQRLDDQAATSYMRGSSGAPGAMLRLLEDAEDPGSLAADVHILGVVLEGQVELVHRVDQLRQEAVAAAERASQLRLEAEAAEAEAADNVEFVAGLRREAAQLRAEAQADRDRQAQLLAALQDDKARQEALLASVSAEIDQLSAERRAAAEEVARRAAEEEQRRARAAAGRRGDDSDDGDDGDGGGGGGGGAGGTATASGPCAVDGAVVGRDFSNDWGYPRSGGRRHEGTDVFANRGTPIRSVASGTVKTVRHADTGLGGRIVSIWVAPGEYWYYAHLESVAAGLSEGDTVSAGQQIGTVGDSGNARGTPPHLHIGNYLDGNARNPYPVLATLCR